jgi:polyisoprenoid-binding protein YceI
MKSALTALPEPPTRRTLGGPAYLMETYRMRLLAPFAAALMMGSAASAAPYVIDPDHTQITFQVSHLGFSMINGHFRDFEMDVDFDPDDIEASKVEVVIDAVSIDTLSNTRDTHTRTYKDLLNVEVFPAIRFKSTRVKLTSAETADITGDLTIRDVTRSVTFKAVLNRIGPSPVSRGAEVVGLSVTGEVDRTAFGVNFAAPAVGAIVPIRVELEMSPAS